MRGRASPALRAGIRIVAALACVVAFSDGAVAQSRTPAETSAIHVLRSSQISTARPDRPHVESFLALDPRDRRHMIAAAMLSRSGGELGTGVYVTFDGGEHWMASKIAEGDSSLLIGGDPIVYFTRNGTPLFGVGSRVDGRPATVVSRSSDGGRSWESPAVVNYRDRPFMAFDTTSGKLDGTIYLGGQYSGFLLSRSTDDGRSYSYPDIIARDRDGADPTLPVGGVLTDILVSPDGMLVMPFLGEEDLRHATGAMPAPDSVVKYAFRVFVSDDGGRSFLPMREGPKLHGFNDFRFQQIVGAPRAAMDESRGGHRGRLYLVWSDWDAEREGYVIRLGRSDDLGKTWKTTIVNDNRDGRDPNNPAIAVNRDGIVGVIWNDRRDDPENRCWRLYGAISADGGETFLPNAKLSSAPSCTNSPGNWVLNTWYQYDYWSEPERPRPGFGLTAYVPVRFPNGGDTQGLVADAEGNFHAAWINGATNTLQLWYTSFAVDTQVVARVRAKNAAHAVGAVAAEVPAGKVDVTQELTFEVSRPVIDFERGTLEVTMRVVNPTTRDIRGPIDVVIDRLTDARGRAMGLEKFTVANADNRKPGIGASWTFEAGPAGVLAPKGKTPPRVLRFHFVGGVPSEPSGYFEPAFRIFAR